MNLHLSDDDLLALHQSGEADRVERKESYAAEKIREAVCGFANDLPGHAAPGVVFVGIRDDGASSGLKITDDLLLKLGDVRDDGTILPRPTVAVEKRTLLGHDVAVIVVAPADAPPVRYKGRVHVRIGPRHSTATAQDERILSERRRFRDLPFDIQPVHAATLADLDRRAFEEEYLPSAFAADVLEANERSYEQRLVALRMVQAVDALVPTVLGVLVLAAEPGRFVPGAYVQFVRYAGTELADAISDSAVLRGSLTDVLRRLDDKLRAHIRSAVDLTSGPQEQRSPEYPIVAIEQLVRNAVMHRTYESTNSPIRVNWFDDRIEIQSPGGPFGVVTVSNFGKPGLTDYRNPNLADAMRTLGFVQRFGVGIATAQRALERNGNPPLAWEVNENHVLALVRRRA